MGSRRCVACVEAPVATCGRCSTTRCAVHKFKAGERCTACERDFRDEALTRRAVKLIFAAPVGLFCGGTLFALLSFGGALGDGHHVRDRVLRRGRCGRGHVLAGRQLGARDVLARKISGLAGGAVVTAGPPSRLSYHGVCRCVNTTSP